MNTLILLTAFAAIVGLEVWALLRILRPLTRPMVRRVYWLLVVASLVASCVSTFHYEHMLNSNTRFVGWPVPLVIFQRDPPDGPWLDYVGLTALLAWPMNFILFTLLPSLMILPFTRRAKQHVTT